MPAINKSIGEVMAGFNEANAKLMRGYQQAFPGIPLERIAQLTGIPRAELDNYAINKVGTPATNTAYGQVTSARATETQNKTVTPRNSAGSGSAFAGNDIPPATVSSNNTTPRINPITGRAFTTPTTPAVTSPTSSQTNTNTSGSAGSQFAFTDTPTPVVSSPTSSQTATNTTGSGTSFQGGGTIASQAFGNGGRDPAPVPSPPAPPPPRPVPEDPEVDFTEAYGDSYTEVTPIPPSTRRPGVEQAQPFQPPQRAPQTFEEANEDIEDAYSEDFRTPDDIARANRASVATPTPRPDITAPEPPPARPAQEISQVDDFGGTGITEVDDFGGPSRNVTPVDDFAEYQAPAQVDDFGAPSRNVTPVDDFAEYQAPAQVDDFAEINTPAQVDDFGGYSNNDFGTEDPGLDAFGPGPAPAQVDDFAEYQPPAQVDDFAEFQAPAQVDDFADYSNNDFGTEDPGLDAFGPGPAPAQVDDFAEYQPPVTQVDDFGEINSPAQVDDFADYSDNDFGAQVDDFGEINTPAQVDDFGEYSDNDFGTEEEDFSDFATPEEVNPFGVDDFGDPEAAQFDEFGDPLRAPDDVEDTDDYGDLDDIGQEDDRVDNDGESLVGDDDTLINDPDANAGIDGVEQAAISNAQTQAINAQAMKQRAQQQQTIAEMREASGVKNADGDWRVKLRLAPQATYLYKAANPGILAPLAKNIIFIKVQVYKQCNYKQSLLHKTQLKQNICWQLYTFSKVQARCSTDKMQKEDRLLHCCT